MDIPATQKFDDDDFLPTQKIPSIVQEEKTEQVGRLIIGSTSYPINNGISKIGRHPLCDIIINDQTVSKEHAEIEADVNQGSTWICDLNSSNKTKLNNVILRSSRYYELKNKSIVEFGKVRAVYEALQLNDSAIPETPLSVNRQKTGRVISETPDSSSDTDNSAIVGTRQSYENVFRYPSRRFYQKKSVDNVKQSFQHNVSDSWDDSRMSAGSNNNEGNVSIFDLETQKPFEINKEVDIHDVETLQFSVDQPIIRESSNAETTRDRIEINNVDKRNHENVNVRRGETCVDSNSSKKIQSVIDIHDVETQKVEVPYVVETFSDIQSKDKNAPMPNDNVTSTEGIKLGTNKDNHFGESLEPSVALPFREEFSKLDDSARESPNLLEGYVDEYDEDAPQAKALSQTNALSEDHHQKLDPSTDDENIFEVATQLLTSGENVEAVTKTNEQSRHIPETDSETDEEGVFSNCKPRNVKNSNERADGSDTDEEGRFLDLAQKRKSTLLSSDVKLANSSKEKNDSSSSRDSDDIFTMATQRTNVDEDGTPEKVTQNNNKSLSEKLQKNAVNDQSNSEDADIGELATQILTSTSTSIRDSRLLASDQKKYSNAEDKVEDIDYEMAPTQRIDEIEFKKDVSKKVSLDDTLERNLQEMFDGSTNEEHDEPIQETTQRLKEVLEASQNEKGLRKSSLHRGIRTKNVLVKENTKEIKPNGTLEEKLADIFDGPIDVECDSLSRMSTQCLKDALERSAEKVPVPDMSTPADVEGTFKDLRVVLVDDRILSQNSVVRQSSADAKETESDADSQNTDKYFSKFTRRRKINVFEDSQDSEVLVNKNRNDETHVIEKSKTKSPSLRRSRRNKAETNKIEVCNAILSTDDVKIPEDVSNDSSKVSGASNDIIYLTDNVDDDTPNDLIICTGNSPNNEIHGAGTSKLLNQADEDILAGLPAVRISGTLSNPASPSASSTSTVHSIKPTNKTTKKQKAAPSRKSLRKTSTSENIEKYCTTKKRQTLSALAVETNDYNKATIESDSDEDIKQLANRLLSSTSRYVENAATMEKSNKQNTRLKSGKSVRGKRRISSDSVKSDGNSDCSDSLKKSPSMQRKLRSRNSKKSKVSDISQTENKIATKDTNDLNDKEQQLDKDKMPVIVIKRTDVKSIGKSQKEPASILDYLGKKDTRLTRKKTTEENDDVSVSENSEMSTTAIPKRKINVSPVTRRAKRQRHRSKEQNLRDDLSIKNEGANETEVHEAESKVMKKSMNVSNVITAPSEESQEVEIIMQNACRSKKMWSDSRETKKSEEQNRSINIRTRRRPKNPNSDSEVSNTDTASSDLCSSENTIIFEKPIIKPKRAKTANKLSKIKGPDRKTYNTLATSFGSGKVAANSSMDKSRSDESLEQIATTPVLRSRRSSKAKGLNDLSLSNCNEADVKNSESEPDTNAENISQVSTPSRTRRTLSMSILSNSSPSRIKKRILFTGIQDNEYNSVLKKLGGQKVEEHTKCDVLVTDKVRRTYKFLCALAQGIPTISIEWLTESATAGYFLDWENYILKDPVAEAKFGFRLRKSLDKARQQKLLNGYTVVLTPNVAPPPIQELKSMITSCGGKVLIRAPNSWPKNAVVVSREDDLLNARKFISKAPKDVTVQSTEFILTGILKQELDFVKYKLI